MLQFLSPDSNLCNPPDHVLDTLNPTRKQYAICVKQEDFLHSTSESAKTHSFSSTTVFCFMTYYPFLSFYQHVFEALLSDLKLCRIGKQACSQSVSSYDASSIPEFFAQAFQDQVLEQLFFLPQPHYSYSHRLAINLNQSIPLSIERDQGLLHQLPNWQALLTVKSINLNHFLNIFFALIQEKTLVLLSKSLAKVTAAVQTF